MAREAVARDIDRVVQKRGLVAGIRQQIEPSAAKVVDIDSMILDE